MMVPEIPPGFEELMSLKAHLQAVRLLVWLGIYKLYRWSYLYSFTLYILLSFLFRKITKNIVAHSSSE